MRRSKALTRLALIFKVRSNRIRSAETREKSGFRLRRYPSFRWRKPTMVLSGVKPGLISMAPFDAAAHTPHSHFSREGGLHGGCFSGPKPRSQAKDSDWKTYEPGSIRRWRDAYLDLEASCARSRCRERRNNAGDSEPGAVPRSIRFGGHRTTLKSFQGAKMRWQLSMTRTLQVFYTHNLAKNISGKIGRGVAEITLC